MDSENESSSIKLRKYAKKAIVDTVTMKDGTIHEVPNGDDVHNQMLNVANHLATIDKAFGKETTSALRRVRNCNY